VEAPQLNLFGDDWDGGRHRPDWQWKRLAVGMRLGARADRRRPVRAGSRPVREAAEGLSLVWEAAEGLSLGRGWSRRGRVGHISLNYAGAG